MILFTDTAAGARQSSSISGNVLTITRELQAARNSAVKIAHGRKEAALLLFQFGYSENTAAVKLRPIGRGVTDYARAVGAKNWEYRALATEEEAKAFLESTHATREEIGSKQGVAHARYLKPAYPNAQNSWSPTADESLRPTLMATTDSPLPTQVEPVALAELARPRLTAFDFAQVGGETLLSELLVSRCASAT